jgi:integrase
MSNAWIFQEAADVRDLGDKAPWQVGWYEPSGRRKKKSFGPGFMGRKRAEKHKHKIEDQLTDGTYEATVKADWDQFAAEYDAKVLAGKAVLTRVEALATLAAFQRIVKPRRMNAITTRQIDEFIARRRQEPGRNGQPVSPATVNKNLRHLKAALKKARKWGYVRHDIDFEFQREPGKIPTFVSPEEFALLYGACDQAARWPADQPYPAADWWKGLLVTAYMTGWRIGQLMALKRDDVDLDAGTALTRFRDNKGKRDQVISLHPLVVQHLRRLAGFDAFVFPWTHPRRSLFEELHRIEHAAGVHAYGFHDLRRAFATMNAGRMTADALQHLMQHSTYATTQRYINLAQQMNPAVQNLFVPDIGPRKAE